MDRLPRIARPFARWASANPVRYFNGAIELRSDDLQLRNSAWFGHTRYYNNRTAGDYDGPNGYNWFVSQMPYVAVSGSSVAVVFQPNSPYWFDRVGSAFVPRYGTTGVSLTRDAVNRRLTFKRNIGGRVLTTVFNDVDAATAPRRLVSHTDGQGTVTEVVSYAGGQIGEVQRNYTTGGTTTAEERIVYTFVDSGVNAGHLQSVTYSRMVQGAWKELRRASYAYYGTGDANGSLNDLKTATVQTPDGSNGWKDVSVSYYRYYTSGYVHGLRYALGPEGYRRMFNAGLDPLTASDAQLADYAEHYFEYDGSRRVTKEVAAVCPTCVGGGTSADLFSYATSTNPDGYNSWRVKTTVDLPDGGKDVVYTNHVGLVMLRVFEEGGTGRRWHTYYKYDADGHQIWETSAVASFSDAAADLQVSIDGLIHVTKYHDMTDLPTGKVAGYVEYEAVRNGPGGSDVKLRSYEYLASPNDPALYLVSKEVVYAEDALPQTRTIETSFAYQWHSSTAVIKQITTTLPAVPADQNGSGVSATTVEVFDEFGNLTWRKDERGFITRQVFDVLRGVMTQRIEDVDTAHTSDEPSGWSTPAGGGLHLVGDYGYDDEGRVVQVLGPSHTAVVGGTATTVRTANWPLFKESARPASGTWGEDEQWSAAGYATGSAPNYTYTLVDPVTITRKDKLGRAAAVLASKRTTGSGRLAPSDTFGQPDWRRWSVTRYDDRGRMTYTRAYHSIPASGEGTLGTNYDQTDFGYDAMERRIRTRSPGGTITRLVLEARGRAKSLWIGTNDTDATAVDPTGGGAAGNDMVKVEGYEYDAGSAAGARNLTELTRYASATDMRVTTFGYDWRNRLVSEDGELDHFAQFTYDNLSRVTRTDHRDTTASGNLIGRSESRYDDRGRIFRSIVYAVDPASGTIGNSLVGDTWYDASGNPIKSIGAGQGEVFTKSVFDGLGRAIKSYVGYDTAETMYADAATVAGDAIVQQTESMFDAAGNLIQATLRERLHDASGTGELTSVGGSQPKARVSYAAMWYDGVGRQIASADYGTNSDVAFSRSVAVPARSDTALVRSTEYDEMGNGYRSIDPKGIETRSSFDHLGRQTKLIEAFDDGNSTTGPTDRDRTTEFAYTSDGQVRSVTAKNASTGDQVTRYIFGTTLSDSGVARKDLLRAVIHPDSDDTESPLGNGTDGVYDRVELKYNRLGEATEQRDQNQTTRALEYDKLGRMLHDRVIALGAGVDQAVRRISRSYESRGMPEKVTSYDDAAVGSGNVVNEVQAAYNGFRQFTVEYQSHSGAVITSSTPKVQYGYTTGLANHIRPMSLTYPNGRVISYAYGTSGGLDDVLNRVWGLKEGTTTLVVYTHLGLSTVVRLDYPQPQMRLDLWGEVSGTYAGLDRFNRVIDQRWVHYGGDDRDRFQYGYDRTANPVWKDNPLTSGRDEFYDYDNLDRLVSLDRGDLNAGRTAIFGTPAGEEDWTLDPQGNWSAYVTRTSGSTNLNQSRTHNRVNEITGIQETIGPAWPDPAHDRAGNMTSFPKPMITSTSSPSPSPSPVPSSSYTAFYDAWNRLIEVKDAGNTVVKYRYDGLDRRVIEESYSGGRLVEIRHLYYSEAWQVIEERVGISIDPDCQYVWGVRYADDLLMRDRLTERLYVLQDANWNVTALADTTGQVVERHLYEPYGAVAVHNADWTLRIGGTAYDWQYLHQGGRRDPSTDLYHFRNRQYSSRLGRWIHRDPLEFVDGLNLYEYLHNAPVVGVDPLGTDIRIPCTPAATTAGTAQCVAHGGMRTIECYTTRRARGRVVYFKSFCNNHGDCWFVRHREWQAAVDRLCQGGVRACPQNLRDCTIIQDRFQRNIGCFWARNRINRGCYRGGNPGHRQAAQAAMTAALLCRNCWRAAGCPGNLW